MFAKDAHTQVYFGWVWVCFQQKGESNAHGIMRQQVEFRSFITCSSAVETAVVERVV